MLAQRYGKCTPYLALGKFSVADVIENSGHLLRVILSAALIAHAVLDSCVVPSTYLS